MGTQRPNGSLYTRIHNRVAYVEFGHPASNSFVSGMLERLGDTLKELSGNTLVSVIVLRSEGDGAFCAGASLDELLAVSSLEEGKKFFGGFAGVINAMRRCSKPILGRIQGKAVGGGVGLIAACDYVFATEGAAVRLSELSIGIAPLVIAPAVERKVGKAGLAELSLAPGEWKSAYWAKEKGLYSRVFENVSELDRELEFHAEKLASFSPDALKDLKGIFWEGTDAWEDLLPRRAAMTAKLALSPYTKEALEKLRKK